MRANVLVRNVLDLKLLLFTNISRFLILHKPCRSRYESCDITVSIISREIGIVFLKLGSLRLLLFFQSSLHTKTLFTNA